MSLTFNKNDGFARFVSCANGAGLLKIPSQVAGLVLSSKTRPVFPAGTTFNDGFNPGAASRHNLTRGGIFRGKVSQRKNQHQINRLEERTLPAPNS